MSATAYRTRRLTLAAVAALVALTGLASPLPTATSRAEYPEPSLAPVAWQLDLDWRTPRRITVRMSDGSERAFWYMVYTVTNNTDEERTFFPFIDLVTEDGQIFPANRNIPNGVFNVIQRRTRGLPLLSPSEMNGRVLLLGEDQARRSVAIWEEPMPEMGRFHIFFGGLSGEIVRLKDDEGNELTDEDGVPILVQKTKQLTFRVRGDDRPDGRDAIVHEQERWVMR